jgi:hypothetical protein
MLEALTAAPETLAPLGSATHPAISPVEILFCAGAEGETIKKKRRATNRFSPAQEGTRQRSELRQ